MVPEPNWLVVPERGCATPARGGVGSAANSRSAEKNMTVMNVDAESTIVFAERVPDCHRMEESSTMVPRIMGEA